MDIIFILGRILFGGFFIYSGIKHFTGIKGSTTYAQSMKVPMPHLAVMGTGILLLLGGLSFLFDTFAVIGGILLIIFLFFTSIMMHPFWKKTEELGSFLRNMAFLGAILIIIFLY